MRLLFMGPPGAGKGTQAKIVSDKLGIPHISTGEIFRENIAQNTSLGCLAKAALDAGELVSDDITNGMVKERLCTPDCNSGWLLDGYPRTVPQAEFFDALMHEHHVELNAVVDFLLPNEIIFHRLGGRGRNDDTPGTISHRLDIYRETTAPLIEYYSRRGLLREVDAVGTMDEITSRILEAIHLR